MGLFIVACAIALAFANIDKVQRFKGAGFEAEMKKAVEEAYATTESLKKLAKPLILSTLSNLIFAGRWGGMGKERQHQLKGEMEQLAKEIDVFDADIESESEKYFAWNAIDIVSDLVSAVQKTDPPLEEDVKESILLMINRDSDKYPQIEELKGALSSLSEAQNQVVEPFIEDYEYYLMNRTIRRPDMS